MLAVFQIRSILTPILGDTKVSLDVIAFAAISLGLVYVGSCNEEIAQAIIFALMERSEAELGEPLARLLPLALGLLYLGKQVTEEVTCLSFYRDQGISELTAVLVTSAEYHLYQYGIDIHDLNICSTLMDCITSYFDLVSLCHVL